jgi:thioesterase domain-containing protein
MNSAVKKTDSGLTSRPGGPPAREPSYLSAFQRGEGKTNIFCFLFVGGFRGEFTTFRGLAPLVNPKYSFYGVIARGTDGVSDPHRSVQEMATAYIRQIKALQPEGPYFLVGECFSASVAYETAQQLLAHGDEVGMLAFLDARVPGTTLNRVLGNRLTAHVRYTLSSIRDSPSLTQLRAIRDDVNRLRKDPGVDGVGRFARKFAAAIAGGAVTYLRNRMGFFASRLTTRKVFRSEMSRRLKASGHTYRMAVRRYERQPYSGKISIIASREFHRSNPTMGWKLVQELEVYEVPGKHDTYLAENRQLVADLLRGVIEKAEQECAARR